MKQPRLLTCWMNTLMAMLLLFATAVRPLVAQQSAKPKQSETSQQNSESQEQAFLSETAHDAVFCAVVSFDFNQDFYFLPRPLHFDLQTATQNRPLTEPHFFFSYFRKVFTHHIAINAP